MRALSLLAPPFSSAVTEHLIVTNTPTRSTKRLLHKTGDPLPQVVQGAVQSFCDYTFGNALHTILNNRIRDMYP